MNRLKEFALQAYLVGVTSAPIIGANYNVWENYNPTYTARECAKDAIWGSICGAFISIISPVIVIGFPTYIALKARDAVVIRTNERYTDPPPPSIS